MAKKVKLTEKIKEALRARGVTDFDTVSVYECIAASTRPISQKNSIYDGARMTPEMLKAMVAFQADTSVPLQLVHKQYELPEGQVLLSDSFTEGFDTELNALFYVEAGSEYDSKLDKGIIDEVSVGALPKSACCSKCGFDFFKSNQAKMQLVWDRTCDNDHVIGEDGCHLILDGIENWQELSLVPRGASSRPKILKPDESKLASDEGYRQLAASGVNPEMLTLRASATPSHNKPEDNEMNAAQLLAQLTESKQELGSVQAQLTAKDERIEALTTENSELQTKLSKASTEPGEVEAQLTEKVTGLETELFDVKSSNSQMTVFLADHYKKACALLGQDAKEDPTVETMLETVNDARLALHQIPVGGASENPADDTKPTQPAMYASAAFQTK